MSEQRINGHLPSEVKEGYIWAHAWLGLGKDPCTVKLRLYRVRGGTIAADPDQAITLPSPAAVRCFMDRFPSTIELRATIADGRFEQIKHECSQ